MIAFGYLIAVILIALGLGILASTWDALHQLPKLDQKALVALTQAALAFTGAIATAIFTASIGRSNEYLRAQLNQSVAEATTRLNAELTQSVNASTESLRAELTTSVNASTARLEAELTRSGDIFRAQLNERIPRRYAAYSTIWAALSQYFRALQKFEAGIFDQEALKAAEKASNDASGQMLLVERTDQDAFHELWQELTRLHEIAEDKRDLPDGLRTIWRNEGRNLGVRYQAVRDVFTKRLLD